MLRCNIIFFKRDLHHLSPFEKGGKQGDFLNAQVWSTTQKQSSLTPN
jgi:hypothetical protein